VIHGKGETSRGRTRCCCSTPGWDGNTGKNFDESFTRKQAFSTVIGDREGHQGWPGPGRHRTWEDRVCGHPEGTGCYTGRAFGLGHVVRFSVLLSIGHPQAKRHCWCFVFCWYFFSIVENMLLRCEAADFPETGAPVLGTQSFSSRIGRAGPRSLRVSERDRSSWRVGDAGLALSERDHSWLRWGHGRGACVAAVQPLPHLRCNSPRAGPPGRR